MAIFEQTAEGAGAGGGRVVCEGRCGASRVGTPVDDVILLQGDVELKGRDGSVQKIRGGSDSARMPLARLRPRRFQVRALTPVRYLKVSNQLVRATLTPLVLASASAETRERVQRWNDVVKRMARLAEISFADRAPEGAVQLLVRGEVAALPLKGVIDLSAERARLEKEIAKADADIKRVDAKLGNEKFVANAPEDIVEEEKEKREAAVARKEKILEALERLKKAS
jgi:hypothetical protein